MKPSCAEEEDVPTAKLIVSVIFWQHCSLQMEVSVLSG